MRDIEQNSCWIENVPTPTWDWCKENFPPSPRLENGNIDTVNMDPLLRKVIIGMRALGGRSERAISQFVGNGLASSQVRFLIENHPDIKEIQKKKLTVLFTPEELDCKMSVVADTAKRASSKIRAIEILMKRQGQLADQININLFEEFRIRDVTPPPKNLVQYLELDNASEAGE